jgi:hypothetical protein
MLMAIGDSCLFVVQRWPTIAQLSDPELPAQFNHRASLVGTLLNAETLPHPQIS